MRPLRRDDVVRSPGAGSTSRAKVKLDFDIDLQVLRREHQRPKETGQGIREKPAASATDRVSTKLHSAILRQPTASDLPRRDSPPMRQPGSSFDSTAHKRPSRGLSAIRRGSVALAASLLLV